MQRLKVFVTVVLSAILTLSSLCSPNNISVEAAVDRKTYIKQEIENANSFYSDDSVKQYKYSSMKESPFAFYRGTAHLYYKDLNNGIIPVPVQWKNTSNINTWIQGDLHTQNLGFFDNDNGKLVMDINDFDEAYLAPFYWDLIRCVASIYLMKDEVGFNMSSSEAQYLATYFLEQYQNTLENVTGNDGELSAEMTETTLSGFTKDTLLKLKNERSNSTLLGEWTTISSGVRLFNFANPKLSRPSTSEYQEISSYWSNYKYDIYSFSSKQSVNYFKIKDIAVRLMSGLGSLGVKKYYVLIEGPTSSLYDDLLLEVKEERLPSMFLNPVMSLSQYNTYFSSHAKRAKIANKAMGRNVDNHLGAFNSSSRSYLVRKISPYKYGYEANDFKSESDLQNYLKYSAIAVAYAHSRADKDYNTYYIPYGFDKNAVDAIKIWPSFKTTVVNLGQAYSDQVRADYTSFVELVNSGDLN